MTEFVSSDLFDPDNIPRVDVHGPRREYDRHQILTSGYPHYVSELRTVDGYVKAQTPTILSHMGDITMRRVDGTISPHSSSKDMPVAEKVYRVVVPVPIGVEKESVDGVEAVFGTIAKAADELFEDGKLNNVMVLPWLNYGFDRRRDVDKAQYLDEKARGMTEAIDATLEGHNVDTTVVTKRLPEGTNISEVKQGIADFAAGYFRYTGMPVLAYERVRYNTKLVFCDYDTQLSEGSLSTVDEVLGRDAAIMMNGTLHYTGGVMDLPPQQVAELGAGQKMIYLTEMLRRSMFDQLPPTAPRGYMPETGLSIKRGVLISLGAFATHVTDNESYWLMRAADEAVRRRFDPTTQNYHPRYPDSSVDNELAVLAESGVRYESYERFGVDTSIRGLEELVRTRGVEALITFDQGRDYALWSDLVERPDLANDRPDVLSREEAGELLNSIYSYFKDCGGQLLAEEIVGLNHLIHDFFARSDSRLFLGTSVWIPSYVPKQDRPRPVA